MSTDRLVKVTLTADTSGYKAKMTEASRATSTFGANSKRHIAAAADDSHRLAKSGTRVATAEYKKAAPVPTATTPTDRAFPSAWRVRSPRRGGPWSRRRSRGRARSPGATTTARARRGSR